MQLNAHCCLELGLRMNIAIALPPLYKIKLEHGLHYFKHLP